MPTPDPATLRHRQHWHYRGQHRPTFALEPAPNQESVWDYPRPPRVAPDTRPITVHWRDTLLAATRSAVRVLETAGPPTFYLPPQDVATELLRTTPHRTHCEWKGEATFFNIVNGPEQAAWTYPNPYPEFTEIAGWIAFYPTQLTCHVAGERVHPQPGTFYGGWITAEIVGPFKGDPTVPDDV